MVLLAANLDGVVAITPRSLATCYRGKCFGSGRVLRSKNRGSRISTGYSLMEQVSRLPVRRRLPCECNRAVGVDLSDVDGIIEEDEPKRSRH
jgi:hypothetical protein